MISKAMILGAAAAVVATGTGFYIATSGDSSPCKGGCPISAMFEAKKSEEPGGSCCADGVNKASALMKPATVETPTLAACVGSGAYATHSKAVSCCADE